MSKHSLETKVNWEQCEFINYKEKIKNKNIKNTEFLLFCPAVISTAE